MFPARVHMGQIIADAAIMVSTIWSASHSAAAALDQQPALGLAWLTVSDFPLIWPDFTGRRRAQRGRSRSYAACCKRL